MFTRTLFKLWNRVII